MTIRLISRASEPGRPTISWPEFWSVLGFAVMAMTPGGASIAQDDPAQTAMHGVTIEAQRATIDHRVRAFIGEITRSTRFDSQSLAKWHQPLCFLVGGLPKTQDEFVLSRLSQTAASADIGLAPQPCRPNFFVLLTSEPDRLLKQWSARNPHLFGNATPAQIRGFIEPSRPRTVRAWHNAVAMNRDGTPLIGDPSCGLSHYWTPGAPPVSCQYQPSRLVYYDVQAFSLAIVVVDTTRARSSSFGQLADYVAMVGLAQIDPDADVGDAPTILRLFTSSPIPPPGLTAWDRAFLSALYHTDQSSPVQRSQIAVRMVQDVSQ